MRYGCVPPTVIRHRSTANPIIYLIMNNDVDLTLSRHGPTSNGNRHASKQPMPIPNFEPNLLAITEQGALPIIIWNCLLRRQLISLLG